MGVVRSSSVLRYSLGGLLGDGGASALDGASGVADSLRVHAEGGAVSLTNGLLDTVAVSLLVLVMVSVVLRLCHPFSIYYADYIKIIIPL